MTKKRLTRVFFLSGLVLVLGLFFFQGYEALAKKSFPEVENSVFSQQENAQYLKFKGEIKLPARGYWQINDLSPAGDITEIYLIPTAPVIDKQMGDRLNAVMEKKQTKKGRYFLQQILWPCAEHAKNHNNTGPSSLQELPYKKHKYMLENLSRSPYAKTGGEEVEGPFIFLVPKTRFIFADKHRYVQEKNKKILAWELRPYVDDGKHWVLYTNGTCRREPIDKKLVKKYGQVIRPIKVKQEIGESDPANRLYSLAAVFKKKPKKPLTLTLTNVYSGENLRVKWPMNKALRADENQPVDLTSKRVGAWLPYIKLSRSPILSTWLAVLDKENAKNLVTRRDRRMPESLSVFDILGGRAAVRETLQMQVLNAPAGEADKAEDYKIDVTSIAGVKVKSHPFREMLKKSDKKGGTLALADVSPHDRFFVYLANPKDIMAFLDQGSGFLHRVGTNLTGNSVDYGLDRKYPERLGFNRKLLDSFLKLGTVSECALIFPDLFFIDGTDVSVVCRLAKAKAAGAVLKLMGINETPGEKIFVRKLKNGDIAYWALWEDLLIIGTNEQEIQKVLDLSSGDGKGSLGRSDEFRYMLTQLPINKSTWSYVYLSDPFIRRLVSPAVKIGQLRRIGARAEMEYLTACALLAQLDGLKSPWSIESLTANGCIPEKYKDGDYFFDSHGALHSRTYGRAANMKTLLQVPVDKVSEYEEKAYSHYLNRYSNYWRQYFDPIALRFDELDDGFLEAEIFILPLIENSTYNALKSTLKKKEDNVPLKIPRLSADPVLMLSLNLGEKAWQGIVEAGYSLLSRYLPIHPAVFEDFGPGFHLALHDADPVIALGSGDLLGAFNAGMPGASAGGMLSLPVVLSVLTRPCTLIIETQNPQRTLNFLRQTVPALRMDEQWRELQLRVHQVENRDKWVFSFNLAGMIKLRFGIELDDEFLLIRNIPWSHDEKIIFVDKTALNSASLISFPDACELQLPGLFEAAMDRSLSEALQGAGHLYPLVLSGYAAVEEAGQRHAELFGFMPVHPGEGRFTWENFQLKSSEYGSVYNQRQPAYKKGDTKFGLLEGFRYLSVSMQFEDTGLRTKFRWAHLPF